MRSGASYGSDHRSQLASEVVGRANGTMGGCGDGRAGCVLDAREECERVAVAFNDCPMQPLAEERSKVGRPGAERYDRARPSYPNAVIDEWLVLSRKASTFRRRLWHRGRSGLMVARGARCSGGRRATYGGDRSGWLGTPRVLSHRPLGGPPLRSGCGMFPMTRGR